MFICVYLWLIPWLNDGGDTASLVGFTIITAYRYAIENNRFLVAIEPAFRFDRMDPDTDQDNDAAVLITPGVNFYFYKNVRLMFNYDIVAFEDSTKDTESAFQFRAQYIFSGVN